MAVNLSPFGGVGAQFLDNSGNVLTGGKIETYAAGTTTPQATYTSSAGNIFHPNPIILDASGRVPSGGEIWLTDGLLYKFVLKDSNNVLIATYDNIAGINSNFVNFTSEQEIQTATAGQTVFTLTTVNYTPGTNSLSVFVDGVNQYGPGAQYAYLETDSTTVTFVNGLHVGASVKFTTAAALTGTATNANVVIYDPAGVNAVSTTVQTKLRETVSVKDFGAVGDGVADDTTAIQNAINAVVTTSGVVYFPAGTYNYTPNATFNITISGDGLTLKGDIGRSFIKTDYNGIVFNVDTQFRTGVDFLGSDGLQIQGLYFENQNFATTNTNATCFYVFKDTTFGALCDISDCTFGRYTNCAVHGIRAWNWSIKRTNFYGVGYKDDNPSWPATDIEAGIRLWGADGTLTVQDHSFSNLCLIENCNFQYLYQGLDLWGSSVTNNVQDCTFQFSTIGINVRGDSTLSGSGSAATLAGFGANLSVVTSNNCWFEKVWRGVVGSIVNPTTGVLIAAGADPTYPNQTQGAVFGNVAQNFDASIPADSYRGLVMFVPVVEGVSGTGTVVNYFNAQTQSSTHYRLKSDEFDCRPPAKFNSTVTTIGKTSGTVGDNNNVYGATATFGSYAGSVYQSNTTRAGNSAFNHFACVSNSVVVNATLGNGNVVNLNNSYGPISDIKNKDNITDATPKLDDLMKVRVVNYNLKQNPELKQIGVIAQELESVFPGLVDEIEDRDENGELNGEKTKWVKMSVFVPMLIKAIQELKAEIDELKKD